jgi:hypothetical protein
MLNAKQRKALRAMPAKQRKAAEQNMRAQNATRITGNRVTSVGNSRTSGNRVTSVGNSIGGGAGRSRNGPVSGGKNHVHLRALNPFDSTPGYQLTPMVERTLKAKLVCDAAYPVTVPTSGVAPATEHYGCSYGMFSPNGRQVGISKWAIRQADAPSTTVLTSKDFLWNNAIDDKDYLIRPVSWGVSLKYCGEPRYARGQIAVVFVDHIEGSTFSQPGTLTSNIEKAFAHPRATIIDVPMLARVPCGFNVPVLDLVSYQSWKRVAAAPGHVETREVGQTSDQPTAPEGLELSTAEQKYNLGFRSVVIATRGIMESNYDINGGVDHWPSLRIRCTMDVEYRRGTDSDAGDSEDTMFRNYATTNPSASPSVTHTFMARAGQLVDTVRDALNHPITGLIMGHLGGSPLALPPLPI